MRALYNFYPRNTNESLITITGSDALTGYPLSNLLSYKPQRMYKTKIKDDAIVSHLTWVDSYTSSVYVINCITELDNGVLLAGTGNTGKILRSTDDGATWNDLGQQSSLSQIVDIIDIGSGVCLACGNSGLTGTGKILRSTDYGATWTNVSYAITPQILVNRLKYAGSNVVYAGTYPNAYLYKSTNGGATWSQVTISADSAYYLNDIVVTSTYIVIARDGKIYKSIDNGVTWSRKPSILDGIRNGLPVFKYPYYERINKLQLMTNGDIYAGTINGHILISRNAGDDWEDIGRISSDSSTIYHFCEMSTGIVLCVSTSGNIFKTIDSGVTWFNTGNISADRNTAITKLSSGEYILGTGSRSGSSVAHIYTGTLDDYSVAASSIIKYDIDSTIRSYDSFFINRINFSEFYIEGSNDDTTWTTIKHVENLTRDEIFHLQSIEQNKPDEYIHYYHYESTPLTYRYIRLRIPNQLPVFGVGVFQVGNFMIGLSSDIADVKPNFTIQYIKKVNPSQTSAGFINEYKSGRTRRTFVGTFDKVDKTEYNKIIPTDAPFVLFMDFNNDPTEAYLVKSMKQYNRNFEEIAENASTSFSFEEIV